jgi:dTDP-4-amino-4,6-dideoxygalactose transaminase
MNILLQAKSSDYYDQAFLNHEKIEIPFRSPDCKHVFHQYTLTLKTDPADNQNRDGLNQFLADRGVPSMIYYPVPCHKQKMFESLGGSSYNLPITDWLTERVISLPIHTELDEEQQDFIISNVLEYIN